MELWRKISMWLWAACVVGWVFIIALGIGLVGISDAQAKLTLCQFFDDGYNEGWCAAQNALICTSPPLIPLCFEGDHRTERGAFATGFVRGQRDQSRSL